MPASSRPEPLTRDEIVATALRMIERDGLDALTMRGVAAELGVTPMAVYYYVKGKQELLALVAEAVLDDTEGLHLAEDGWEASLRRHLLDRWERLARYPGLGARLIEQPTLGVTEATMKRGIEFFEQAGFDERGARLAWSFALTWLHGRLSVDARLGRNPSAPRPSGLHARDYAVFGVDAVVAGLRALMDGHRADGNERRRSRPGATSTQSANGGRRRRPR